MNNIFANKDVQFLQGYGVPTASAETGSFYIDLNDGKQYKQDSPSGTTWKEIRATGTVYYHDSGSSEFIIYPKEQNTVIGNFTTKTNMLIKGGDTYSGTTDGQLVIVNGVIDTSEGYIDNEGLIIFEKHITTDPVWEIGNGYKSVQTVSTDCESTGSYSVADGYHTYAYGDFSKTEGYYTTAGTYAHAEGIGTKATGNGSHSEGYHTTASGKYSYAGGMITKALGDYSHAEGYYAESNGSTSHAEGYDTRSNGIYSHVGGYESVTSGLTSFVHSYQSYSISPYSVIIGGRSNILTETATGSTITAASGITGTEPWTLYTQNINIAGLPTLQTNILTTGVIVYSGTTACRMIWDGTNFILSVI
jgi:hypothetical protein